MSSLVSKRKRQPVKKSNDGGATKRNKRKEIVMDSDMSDASDNDGGSVHQPDEVLIAGHGDIMDEPAQLPQELLNSLIKPAGQLLIFGSVNWETAGKKENRGNQKLIPHITSPHRFTDLRVRLAVSGCVAAHNVLVTEDGKVYTFGRNQFGQLGINNTTTKCAPTLVTTLENANVIGAACGRNHTLFLTDTGTVYACGDNRSGQCGVGNSQQQLLQPTKINYRGPPIIKVGCGADFSVILDVHGGLHSFGLPEYGQLGHNTDGKYFKTSTKLSFHFVTSPKRIMLYIEKSKDKHITPIDVEVADFSCGQNHTVAIDSQKRVFSWGFGGLGRLGHAEPKDEMIPRLIKYFDSQSRGVRSVHCGSTYSLAVTDFNMLLMFGQTKRTGEANMYPKPVQELAGCLVNHVATGNTSIIIAADDFVTSWGASPTFGELGLGDLTKSTTVPKEVTSLSNVKVLGLSMGMCHSLLIAQNSTPEQQTKLETFDVFEP